ncbi:MAG TPA: hypothetical protein VMM35_10430 [Longimicrobiales bacterium]|nr:hypothetical protein [Longimicrobiales bacterium]
MRRTFAVLALLTTSWPHAVALECTLGSTPPSAEQASHHGPAAPAGAEGSAHHGAAHHGAGHQHGTGDHARSDAGTAAGGLQCAMVMACGLVMMQSESGIAVADARSAPEAAFRPSLDAPAAAELAAEPPPPRRDA